MAPKIITSCGTKGCGRDVVVSREAENGPVTGECAGCGAAWRLADGRLQRLSPHPARTIRC